MTYRKLYGIIREIKDAADKIAFAVEDEEAEEEWKRREKKLKERLLANKPHRV